MDSMLWRHGTSIIEEQDTSQLVHLSFIESSRVADGGNQVPIWAGGSCSHRIWWILPRRLILGIYGYGRVAPFCNCTGVRDSREWLWPHATPCIPISFFEYKVQFGHIAQI